MDFSFVFLLLEHTTQKKKMTTTNIKKRQRQLETLLSKNGICSVIAITGGDASGKQFALTHAVTTVNNKLPGMVISRQYRKSISFWPLVEVCFTSTDLMSDDGLSRVRTAMFSRPIDMIRHVVVIKQCDAITDKSAWDLINECVTAAQTMSRRRKKKKKKQQWIPTAAAFVLIGNNTRYNNSFATILRKLGNNVFETVVPRHTNRATDLYKFMYAELTTNSGRKRCAVRDEEQYRSNVASFDAANKDRIARGKSCLPDSKRPRRPATAAPPSRNAVARASRRCETMADAMIAIDELFHGRTPFIAQMSTRLVSVADSMRTNTSGSALEAVRLLRAPRQNRRSSVRVNIHRVDAELEKFGTPTIVGGIAASGPPPTITIAENRSEQDDIVTSLEHIATYYDALVDCDVLATRSLQAGHGPATTGVARSTVAGLILSSSSCFLPVTGDRSRYTKETNAARLVRPNAHQTTNKTKTIRHMINTMRHLSATSRHDSDIETITRYELARYISWRAQQPHHSQSTIDCTTLSILFEPFESRHVGAFGSTEALSSMNKLAARTVSIWTWPIALEPSLVKQKDEKKKQTKNKILNYLA